MLGFEESAKARDILPDVLVVVSSSEKEAARTDGLSLRLSLQLELLHAGCCKFCCFWGYTKMSFFEGSYIKGCSIFGSILESPDLWETAVWVLT